MVDDNSEHVAHAWRKIGLVLENDCTCSIQMPEANQITEIAPYAHVHTIFLETLVPWIRLWYYGKWIAFSITEPFLCVIDAVKDTDLNHTGRHFYYSLHQDGSALPHHGLTLGRVLRIRIPHHGWRPASDTDPGPTGCLRNYRKSIL